MSSVRSGISTTATMAAADDLNGATTTLDVTGAGRVIIAQLNSGTAGTAGIDIVEISKDGGTTWAPDTTLRAFATADSAAAISGAALNAAGVEPSGAALFKSGPHAGPTLMRVGRGGSGQAGTAWVTGAPAVVAVKVN